MARDRLNGTHFLHTSPPSPELDFPPILFMATAITSCVSLEMAPNDMPPVQNRATIFEADSTSSTGMGFRSDLNSSISRRTWEEEKVSQEDGCYKLFLVINSQIFRRNWLSMNTTCIYFKIITQNRQEKESTVTGRFARYSWYTVYASRFPSLTALWSSFDISGLLAWNSPAALNCKQ